LIVDYRIVGDCWLLIADLFVIPLGINDLKSPINNESTITDHQNLKFRPLEAVS